MAHQWCGLVFAVLAAATVCGAATPIEYDLSKFDLLGIGNVTMVAEDGFVLTVPPLDQSGGVMFVSDFQLPGDFGMEFSWQASTPDGVLVVLIAFRHVDGGPIQVPPDYDGDWAYFRDGDDHEAYPIAFHTHAHQPNTFIRRLPGFDLLALTHDPYEQNGSGRVNEMTITKAAGTIRLLDGDKVLLEVPDRFAAGPLTEGYICFRLSPAESAPFDVVFFDLSLYAL